MGSRGEKTRFFVKSDKDNRVDLSHLTKIAQTLDGGEDGRYN